jgi:acetylornithine/succinyldiaminopimelate/putrescine aminotransferase/predicted amino acid dehydrogenase
MEFELLNPTISKLLKNFKLAVKYVKGEDLYLYDERGRRYLDFIAQYGAVPFGYNASEIWDAARNFLDSGMPAMVQPSVPVMAVKLAEQLIKLAPGEMAQATFCQSGAEAVEAAIKLARSTTGKKKIISTDNSFHGKTMGALSATGREIYQEPFFVPVDGFETVPFDDLVALENKLCYESNEIAAFIVEPIQGEGGIIIPADRYLKQAELICRKYGVLFVVDEIQTGLGRTGYLFACDREGVNPDILLLSKALGGGLVPMGACLSSKQAWNKEFGRLHSSTFANNNFTCSVSLAVLDKLIENNRQVLSHAAQMGDLLTEGLNKISDKYPGVIKEVRGRGLMLGIEFNGFDGSESFSIKHMSEQGGFSAVLAGYLLHNHSLRCAPFLNNPMTLRLQPCLTVNQFQVENALAAIESVTRILFYRDYSELFSYLIGRKITGNINDYRKSVKPVCGSVLEPGEKPTEKFAFIIHYPSIDDFVKNNISFEKFSVKEQKKLLDWEAALNVQPQVIVHMPAIKSKAGKIAEGWLIAIPYSGKHLMEMPRKQAVAHLSEAVDLARSLGAKIVGLGAYTSVVSRGGADLQGRDVSITSGNSYTVAIAFDALIEGVDLMGMTKKDVLTGAVIGATGSIGRVCAIMLAHEVEQMFLVGNPEKGQSSLRRLRLLADEIFGRSLRAVLFSDEASDKGIASWVKGFITMLGEANPEIVEEIKYILYNNTKGSLSSLINNNLAKEGRFSVSPIKTTLNIKDALRVSELIISASSSTSHLIGPEHLKSGCIICDVARPADVSRTVLETRKDVLVIEGGLVRYPDLVCFGQNIGYEPGVNLACLSETVLLALEGDYRDFSIGSKILIEEVDYLKQLALKHGFKLAKPQNDNGEITPETVKAVREAVKRRMNSMVAEQVSLRS